MNTSTLPRVIAFCTWCADNVLTESIDPRDFDRTVEKTIVDGTQLYCNNPIVQSSPLPGHSQVIERIIFRFLLFPLTTQTDAPARTGTARKPGTDHVLAPVAVHHAAGAVFLRPISAASCAHILIGLSVLGVVRIHSAGHFIFLQRLVQPSFAIIYGSHQEMPLCCPQIGLLKQLFGGNNISAVNQNANTLEQWMDDALCP